MSKKAELRVAQGEWAGFVTTPYVSSTGLTAAGTTQGTALVLSKGIEYYQIGTAALNSGVQLPMATVGDEVLLVNNGANALSVYPQTGGKLNNGTANAAVSVGAGKSAKMYALSAIDWVVVVSA